LCPTGAPYISNNGTTLAGGAGFPNAPALTGTGLSSVGLLSFTPCPTATMLEGGTSYAPLAAAIPPNCSTAGWAVSPYFPLVGTSTSLAEKTNAETNLTATWNLIDGWLRVEYLNNSGTWVPVTNEWLQLGFARGMTAPTAPLTNPVNPNAILLLQEPADRAVSGGSIPAEGSLVPLTGSPVGVTGSAPICTAHNASSKCIAWSVTPPQVLVDNGTGSTVWPFGVTTTAMNGAIASSTEAQQSLSRFNWYPINFYDDREGEVRDNIVGDNSCTANGLLNLVEIDVGNLKQWLLGNIGSSGTSVNSSVQNGYVLYFSDRRGMLPNPNAPYGTSFTKSGDSGLEDDINSASAAGTPDGALEPIPAGRTISPEDDNENGVLDQYGADDMGLGFFGTQGSVSKNIWYQITTGGTVMANGTNGAAP